jgi:hypothetical protein
MVMLSFLIMMKVYFQTQLSRNNKLSIMNVSEIQTIVIHLMLDYLPTGDGEPAQLLSVERWFGPTIVERMFPGSYATSSSRKEFPSRRAYSAAWTRFAIASPWMGASANDIGFWHPHSKLNPYLTSM